MVVRNVIRNSESGPAGLALRPTVGSRGEPMAANLKVEWSTDSVRHWHKSLALIRYAEEEPWTAITACGRWISELELGKKWSWDPPNERRRRKCEVAPRK